MYILILCFCEYCTVITMATVVVVNVCSDCLCDITVRLYVCVRCTNIPNFGLYIAVVGLISKGLQYQSEMSTICL